MAPQKEFAFIDETGSPGQGGPDIYGVTVLHLSEECIHRVRRHMTAFRYHHDVVKELKDQRSPATLTRQTRHLLETLAEMTDAGHISATANWVSKATWKANGAPYLDEPQYFRAFQVRLLLERHRSRTPWLTELDVVLDRWKMSEEQRANIEKYLKGNMRLAPRIRHITTVDSIYVDPIQIIDIYARFLRKFAENKANAEERALAERLMSIEERRRGLY